MTMIYRGSKVVPSENVETRIPAHSYVYRGITHSGISTLRPVITQPGVYRGVKHYR